jgi:hypothetical protein
VFSSGPRKTLVLHRRYLVELFFGGNVHTLATVTYDHMRCHDRLLFELRLGRAIFAILH